MSYKLIIVDDEEIVRDGLTSLVDWNSRGFDVAAVLKDGREAIRHIENTSVDVILTDVFSTKNIDISLRNLIK